MRIRAELDNTKRSAFSREIDLKSSRFHLSRHEFLRIILGSSAMLSMAGLAFYFEQYAVMWIAIAWAVAVGLWQLAFYGYMSNPKDKKSLAVTNFYSKGTLIFLASFWTVLIVGVAIALYFKLP
jgi:hypothetical protein